MKKTIDQRMKEILGFNAFNNQGEVDYDVKIMFNTINYLDEQLKIMSAHTTDENVRTQIADVIENVKSILNC